MHFFSLAVLFYWEKIDPHVAQHVGFLLFFTNSKGRKKMEKQFSENAYDMGISDLAKAFNSTESQFYGFTRRIGKDPDAIPHIKLGKHYRFNYQEVLNWLKKRSQRGQ